MWLRIAVSILLASLGAATTVQAALIAVTTTQDEFGEDPADCSLREAVQAAVSDTAFGGCPGGSTQLDTIELAGATYRLSRAGAGEDANATGDIDLSGDSVIIIQGAGAQRTRIDGDGLDRVIDIAPSAGLDVFLLDLTITGGDAGAADGGGVRMRGERLIVRRSHITDNVGRIGGGLYATAGADDVQVVESAVTRNVANGLGGGIHSAGGLTLVNATLSENLSTASGGGLSSSGTASLKNTTVAFNSADSYGGAYFSAGSATIDNSLFADNRQQWGLNDDGANLRCAITVSSGGYNSYTSRDCPFTPFRSSDRREDPRLSTLVDAGRGTPVHLLMKDSPAIDSGAPPPFDGADEHCPSTDQRGVARLTCDRGAFELRYTFVVTNTADAVDANVGNGVCQSTLGDCTLRAAIQEAGASDQLAVIDVRNGVYELNIPGADEDLGATGDLDLRGLNKAARVLVGSGADRVIIRSTTNDRVFDTSSSSAQAVPIGLFGLRIMGGDHTSTSGGVTGGGGMRLRAVGETTIDQVWFDRNRTTGYGGGLHYIDSSQAVGRITRSAFTRNESVEDGGGALLSQGDPLLVSNALFADNVSGGSGAGVKFSNTTTAELAYSTITRNRSLTRGGGFEGDSSAVLTAVISAGNRDAGVNPTYPDCSMGTGASIPSGGYNIIGIAGTGGCVMSGDTSGNQIGVTAPLSGVALAGGVLPHVGVQPGNPALESIPRDDCVRADARFEMTDLHGRDRPGTVSSTCTAGAVEGLSDLVFADTFGIEYAGE